MKIVSSSIVSNICYFIYYIIISFNHSFSNLLGKSVLMIFMVEKDFSTDAITTGKIKSNSIGDKPKKIPKASYFQLVQQQDLQDHYIQQNHKFF